MSADPQEHVTTLSQEAWDELMRILDKPPAPTEALIKAAKAYRDAVHQGTLKVGKEPVCSFCGRDGTKVLRFIDNGPGTVSVCNECVDVMHVVIHPKVPGAPDTKAWAASRERAALVERATTAEAMAQHNLEAAQRAEAELAQQKKYEAVCHCGALVSAHTASDNHGPVEMPVRCHFEDELIAAKHELEAVKRDRDLCSKDAENMAANAVRAEARVAELEAKNKELIAILRDEYERVQLTSMPRKIEFMKKRGMQDLQEVEGWMTQVGNRLRAAAWEP